MRQMDNQETVCLRHNGKREQTMAKAAVAYLRVSTTRGAARLVKRGDLVLAAVKDDGEPHPHRRAGVSWPLERA
jgi:hypothetical protein